MDSGIPHSLLTSLGEIVFNDLTGDATVTASGLSDVATGSVWPGPGVVPASINADFNAVGLPPGNGYLMQFVGGTHGAPVRATIDNRPHKAGGIAHKFFSGPKYMTLTGHIIGDTLEIRQVLYDYLAMHLYAAQNADSRYFFKPNGANTPTRFHTVKCYDLGDIIGPSTAQGTSPAGIAGPKLFDFEFVAVNPFSYTYTERDTTIIGTASAHVDNDGTVETWPVIECYAGGSAMTFFEIGNGTFQVIWTGNCPAGHYIEVNMFEETMFQDRNGSNKIGGLDDQSDFWSIPPQGGALINSNGPDNILIKSNDAWI